jgi:hypothetical protein
VLRPQVHRAVSPEELQESAAELLRAAGYEAQPSTA